MTARPMRMFDGNAPFGSAQGTAFAQGTGAASGVVP
jgi:hypothetical protein